MGEPAVDAVEPEAPQPPPLVRDGGDVAIRDQDGSVSMVRASDLDAASAEGARPATEREYNAAKLGKSGEIAATGIGVGQGLTLGYGLPAIVHASKALGADQFANDVRRGVEIAHDSLPGQYMAGEVAGTVAPMLFGGGAVEGAALADGLVARAAQRAIAAAPRAIAEGAAIGVGEQLSEDTLRNHKLVGENYLTAGFKGGTIGLLLGTAGAAGIGAASDRAASLFGRSVEGAERGLVREESTAYRSAARAEEELAPRGRNIAEREADNQRFLGTGAKTPEMKRLGATSVEQRAERERLGRLMDEQGIGGPLKSAEEQAAQVVAKRAELGKTFAPMYKEADTAAARPSWKAISDRYQAEIRGPAIADGLFGTENVAKADDILARFLEKGGEQPSHMKLWELRKSLDNDKLQSLFNRVPGAPVSPAEEAVRGLRGLVQDELVTSATRAGEELGTKLGDRLATANNLYKDLSTLEKVTKGASQRISGNAGVSLSDLVAAASGGIPGLIAGGANMVRRKYGNQMAAHVLDKVARMESLQGAISKVDETLSRGSRAFVEGKGGPAIRKAAPVTAAEVRELRDVTSNPSAVTARVASAMGDLPKYAPKVAQAMATTAQRTAAYLTQTLPKEPVQTGLSWGHRPARPLSDTELLRAQHIIETAQDPSIVLDRLREGRLTKTHVDTLKATSPETYAAIQSYIRTHGEEIRPTLTVQQQCSLGLLFGTPLNEASLPANIRAFQASFTTGNQAPGEGGTGGASPGPMNSASSRATAFDKMESGQ